MSQPTNHAAYLVGAKKCPLEVREAPYTKPQKDQIVVRNHAVAINPVDWMKHNWGDIMFGHVKYPVALGWDTAGEVVEVGPGVKSFGVGDRVVGFALSIDPKAGSPEGAFQEYTVLRTNVVSKIPATTSYEAASVIPLGASTVACALYQKDQLALQYPTVPAQKSTGKTVLIWGGSTSVGCNAIQLAVASGYEVITTCSPRNFDLVKRLGASQAFDYNSKTSVQDIIAYMNGPKKAFAGALSCSQGAHEACIKILAKCKGDKKHVGVAYPQMDPMPKSPSIPQLMMFMIPTMSKLYFKGMLGGVKTTWVNGATLAFNEVGAKIYTDFLGQGLAAGTFVPAPEPMVVGHGLEKVQEAFDVQQKGVSAKKVVVTL